VFDWLDVSNPYLNRNLTLWTMATVHPKRASAGSLLKRMYAEEQADTDKNNSCAFDMADFPFASGVRDGLKCCTRCGSIKTPQWREGPYGPKTLCNACGVKRTRKLRAEQEGSAKKAPRKSPIKQRKMSPVKEHLLDSAEFRSTSRRAAAQESAYKTHKYAMTGEWAHVPPMFKGLPLSAEPSSSDNVSAPLSDVPEEIAYTPDCTIRTSDDCFAAINLMTMSAKSSLDDTFFSHPLARTDTPQSSPAKVSGLHPSNSDVEAALSKISALAGGGLVIDSNVSALSHSIPPTKVSELIQMTEELENAQREAQLAEANVSSVAAILAAHQASLLQKQMRVNASTERLQRFVFDLESTFGLTYKVLPRIRTEIKHEAQ
jgi:hypothetical protein